MDGAGEGRIVGRKHVCVLYGGRSLERDVSINTGTRVARALEARGHQVSPVDVDESLVRRLVDLNPDVGFIAMHGKGCLLYTSDAADDLTRVDLGGRRLI